MTSWQYRSIEKTRMVPYDCAFEARESVWRHSNVFGATSLVQELMRLQCAGMKEIQPLIPHPRWWRWAHTQRISGAVSFYVSSLRRSLIRRAADVLAANRRQLLLPPNMFTAVPCVIVLRWKPPRQGRRWTPTSVSEFLLRQPIWSNLSALQCFFQRKFIEKGSKIQVVWLEKTNVTAQCAPTRIHACIGVYTVSFLFFLPNCFHM